MNLHRTLFVCALSVIAGTAVAKAVTWTVDDDPGAQFTSVQAGIDAAAFGDTVQVSCGLYQETILMADGVKVLGAGADCTILDGGQLGTVVTFEGAGATTQLSGFTIRNGLANLGGGIYVNGMSTATISHNVISGNAAVKTGSGYYGVGGGIEIYEASPVITNNLFVGNTAERSGGAVDIYQAYPVLRNNTIVGNDAIAPGASFGYGGAIYSGFSDLTLTSNLIYDNVSESGGGGVDVVNSTYTVEFNDLYLNSPLDWSCPGCANPLFPPPPGNVQLDPLLIGGVGSAAFCPRSHSPAIDGGPFVAPPETVDFFGRPRVLNGDFDGFALVDIGFCESDEITMLTMELAGLISWDPSSNGSSVYNLYRGTLAELLTSCATACVYSQDPMVVLEASQECDLLTPSFTDTDTPALNQGYFYLVSGEDNVEGGLGWLGAVSRAHANPCP